MKYRACMHYIIDIPDGEIDGERVSTAEIAEDAQWFIDSYAYESHCSMVEKMGEDE
jgi:hypothetical protein